jgi:preprotein translocase subunit SecD
VGVDLDRTGTGPASVTLTLSEDAATRFEDVTREWTNRRIALIVDDEVDSAPVVKTAIGGGRVSITMAGSEPREVGLEKAKRLARRLGRP